MSRISFDSSTVDDPEVKSALERFESWLAQRPDLQIIDPRKLAKDLPEVSAKALYEALSLLVDHRYLRQVYQVETPTGVLQGEDFESPGQVPTKLPDRLGGSFDTREQEIVPVLRHAQDERG